MSRTRSFGLVLAVCAASRAGGADPLAVHTTGALPFSPTELEAALALRTQLATARSPRRIDAEVTGDGSAVRIALTGRTRRVALDGQQGADAARLVAFAILDLAGNQLDPPDAPLDRTAPPFGGGAGRAQVPAVDPPAEVVRGATIARAADPAWSIGMWGAGGSRSEASLELALRIHGTVRALASAGAGLAETTGSIERRGFPARLGVAWRYGAFEARATAIAVLELASAERSATDVIAGGGGGVVWLPARIGGWALLAGVGGDAFATAIDYRVHGMAVATTERYAWWAGLGVAWEGR